MNSLAIAAMMLSALAILLVLVVLHSGTGERVAAAAWRSDMASRLTAQERAAASLTEALEQEQKRRRILKATLLAARDAHSAKLDEHEERFSLLPEREALEKLVEQHNQMARDLMLLKDEFSTIRSGASLRKAVTGA